MLKVLIATGGTGGHVYPARQLSELLKGTDVLFAGYKLKQNPFFDQTVPFKEIASAPSLKKPFGLLKGFFQSIKLILQFKPDVVVGFGSFYAFPVMLAAALLMKKIVLFEANYTLGKVNRLFVPFAKKVAFQFGVDHPKAIYVPLLPWTKQWIATKKLPKDPERMTILVFGGSQGATFINKTFCKAAPLLKFPIQVIHLTGKEDLELKYKCPAVVKPYEEDMAAAYEAADLIVCRCGAGTTAELIRFKKPAVLIPYPYAYDHQRKNGEYLGEGARVLLQKDATPEKLAEEIELLYLHREKHKKALEAIVLPETIGFDELIRTVGESR